MHDDGASNIGSYAARTPHETRTHGFSLFELLVVIALISTLATVLLNRLAYYQEAAEKANMEYTISALRSALRLHIATLMVEGRAQQNILLAQQNPMNWLETKPGNYAGQFANPDSGAITPGSWYFDTADSTLVYLVRHGEYFESTNSGAKRVRLRMQVVPNRPNAANDPFAGQPTDTVKLGLMEPYRWLEVRL